MLPIFKHLLPKNARAWSLTTDKRLRQFFDGLAQGVIVAVRSFFDLIWLDLFPNTTRELTAWEEAFGLSTSDKTISERRQSLATLWSARGGQDPRYIQDTLQAAGFDLYVHEWWVLPRTYPPVARNPYEVLATGTFGCGDSQMQCGNPEAQCGNVYGDIGYMLVNKVYQAETNYITQCGEPEAQCGNPDAQCGSTAGFVFIRKRYAVPSDPSLWPHIVYIGGPNFGDVAVIPGEFQGEVEDLLLKIVPAHLWIGMLIDFQSVVIDDLTGNDVIDDFTSNKVIAA